MSTGRDESRLRRLVDAGIVLSSELSLDAVLQKLVETAAGLTGAQYAALGVIDESGHALERFVTTGIDAETFRAIGELPHGRGILGVLIDEARPLRLHDLTTDPRSAGCNRLIREGRAKLVTTTQDILDQLDLTVPSP